MDAGLITADTILNDANQLQRLRARQLRRSVPGKIRRRSSSILLNTPAVNLLKQITTQRMIRKLNEIDLVSSRINHANHGLALALGTVGHSLLNLTNAYSTIPNQGFFQKATFINQSNNSPISIAFSRPATQLITQILTSRELRKRHSQSPGKQALQQEITTHGASHLHQNTQSESGSATKMESHPPALWERLPQFRQLYTPCKQSTKTRSQSLGNTISNSCR